ncbi:MAG TPA: hypothetical protein VNZ64_16435 [Candidatus Acidoferrum sp.]|nr:hypothetical protein [Candidatus Acidoferrum sp.]
MSARIALIGHSAAGKSSCIEKLGFSRELADMDRALGVRVAPPVSEFRDWLSAKDTPAVIALSIHPPMLDAYYKAARELGVLLVYLFKSRERIKEHVKLQQPNGDFRPEVDQSVTVHTHAHFDNIFREAKDLIIDCSDKDTAAVAIGVKRILESR